MKGHFETYLYDFINNNLGFNSKFYKKTLLNQKRM